MLWKDFVFAVLIAVPSTPTAPRLPVVIPEPLNATEGYGRRSSDVLPPPRYQYDSSTRLQTVNTQDAMNADCGKPERGTRLGCTRGPRANPVVIVPNPCDYPEERFAHLLCHELGHVQGWGADHEQ